MSNQQAVRLVEALRQKQVTEGLSDRQFAERLGVDVGLWNRTKRGIWPLGESIIDAVTILYPDLREERDLFLRERATIRNTKKANSRQESSR